MEAFPGARLTAETPLEAILPFSPKKDSAEARRNASIFLEACNALYREVDFDGYLRASQGWYRQAQEQLLAQLPGEDFIGSMERFYRKAHDRYILIPSLTLPKGMAFGPRYRRDRESLVFNVFGAVAMQSLTDSTRADMGFGDRTKVHELSVHEFGHSFVNPEIYALPDAGIDSLARLFPPIQKAMEAQGYNTWKSCLIEHFVRAGEVVIARREKRTEAAGRLQKTYVDDRQFIYLPRIIAALEAFQKNPQQSYGDMARGVLTEMGNH